MLVELRIENLGVIESASLMLGPGLTALTGETGAGKTMLVEAVQLLVGGRADAAVVRHGATEAVVEGRFIHGEDEVVLTRVVPVDGRSRAYVNGRLATAGTLAEMGERFVELHGQHAHQSLLTTAAQRAALDRSCATDLGPLRAARARLTEIDASLAALGGDERTRAREIDLLQFQANELRDAQLGDPDEDERLSRREDLLSDASALTAATAQAVAALMDDSGAVDATGAAVRALQGRNPFEAALARLQAVVAELSDVAREIRTIGETIEEDPEALERVRQRRHLLHDLRRKYGDTLADVIAFRDDTEARLGELLGYEQRVAALATARSEAEQAERQAAAEVGRRRRSGAEALGAAVQQQLRQLALPDAVVRVAVDGADPGDEVTVLISTNPGSPVQPLSRVASGGELSRTMLAVRLVLTDAPDTMIFDEVDAGIGGTAAAAVGEALAALSARHQVLVVTHLAQVAALADQQVVVSKHTDGHHTTASVRTVVGNDRVDEVARMLSGRQGSESARRHAKELLGGHPL
jgi:DNA repair protein RecN (Recombination protein N)